MGEQHPARSEPVPHCPCRCLRTDFFEPIPDSCDWRNEAGDDAGCRYAIHDEPYGVLKGFRVEINRVNSSAV